MVLGVVCVGDVVADPVEGGLGELGVASMPVTQLLAESDDVGVVTLNDPVCSEVVIRRLGDELPAPVERGRLSDSPDVPDVVVGVVAVVARDVFGTLPIARGVLQLLALVDAAASTSDQPRAALPADHSATSSGMWA